MDVGQFRKSLDDLIKTREQISQHGGTGNEEFAKQYLILPMLKLLGYKTDGFPAEVRPEYATNIQYADKKPNRRVDYAIYLLNADTPCIFVEAKNLDTKLDPDKQANPVKELADYFRDCDSVELGVLTNGNDYRLFITCENHACNMDMTPILSFNLDELQYNDDKLNALFNYLSKDSVCSRLQPSGKKIIDLYKEDKEKANLRKAVRDLFTSDNPLDGDFIKYVAAKANIQMRWTENNINEYRPKVKDALNRVIREVQMDYLNLVEKSRSDKKETTQNELVQDQSTPCECQNTAKISSDDEALDTEDFDQSKIVTTELELQVIDKIQAIISASSLPKKIWSKTLNDWMPVTVKYKDTVYYLRLLIHERSNEELKRCKKAPRQWAVAYVGEDDITKGFIIFNVSQPEEISGMIPDGFHLAPWRRPGLLGYWAIGVNSINDIDKLAPAIVYCFQKNIEEFKMKNPEP